ncbi:MAG: hypothetical protein ACFFED_11720 [Candidatus Thorarchaeota archaeon]
MSSRFSFTGEMLNQFESEYEIEIMDLISGPSIAMSDDEATLKEEQMQEIIHRLGATGKYQDIIVNLQPRSPSISMSLFVLNDATWKLMEKKEDGQDRMLPMTTIPWFYWNEKAQNKWGSMRFGDAESKVQVSTEKKQLMITGEGGDFCGIVAKSALENRFSPWRIVIPELPSSSKMVTKYESARIKLLLDYSEAECRLYPHPRKNLDYTFSESPKVFYYHGLELVVDGKDTLLKVGNRHETKLHGEVHIFIGRPSENIANKGSILGFHIWLNALFSKLV